MSQALLSIERSAPEVSPGAPGSAGSRPAAAAPAIWLRRLRLTRFRSYASALLEADRRPVVLTGDNGAGKTNLLEAISFLAPGRGLRRARLGEVERRAPGGLAEQGLGWDGAASDGPETAGPWAVAATLETPGGARDIGTGRDPAADPGPSGSGPSGSGPSGSGPGGSVPEGPRERRLVRIDGQPARGQASLDEIVRLVWLTPQMDGLFRDGPGGRRRFLDRLVASFDGGHGGRLAAYETALRQRARLLAEGRRDDGWLAALEETIAGRAVAVAAARRALVARLNEAIGLTPDGDPLSGIFPRPGLALTGETEAWLGEMPALAVEDRLRAGLAEGRGRDAASGSTALGPHRSDLAVSHLGKGEPAEHCSTGEQKALLVAIVLAHARLVALDRDAVPILLLDEVVAHLDAERRDVLFGALLALGAQAWMTGTDQALFSPLGERAQFFEVREGQVVPARQASQRPRP